MSGRAVEAAGDVDTLLLDKTGTITLGNRMATEFLPLPGVRIEELADAAQLASLADETPEGRSIVVAGRGEATHRAAADAAAAAHLRAVHRADAHERRRPAAGAQIRKGAVDAVREARGGAGRHGARRARPRSPTASATRGGTPLAVADGTRVLGIIHLKDMVKGGIARALRALPRHGHPHGDDHRRQPAHRGGHRREAGVDDFLAEATPEAKMRLIKDEQAKGKLVAMTGDGTNDAPALAQADVGVAMNTGTQAAKEAGNMVDLDSNPTKLLEIVEVGKQLLMTRGTLTTFSIANDVAKYFAILPAMFMGVFPRDRAAQRHAPGLAVLGAILSAVIFNALIIIAAHPAGAARRALPAARRGRDPAPLAAHLRRGRRHRAVRRHQAHRPRPRGVPSGLRHQPCEKKSSSPSAPRSSRWS